MLAYIIRRLLLMIVTLFGVSVAIFLLLRIVPGNIADILFNSAGLVDPAEKQKIIVDLGLDKSLPLQYGQWIFGRTLLDADKLPSKPRPDKRRSRKPAAGINFASSGRCVPRNSMA